jgi:pyrroline-5-carboxylate reductase
MTISIIGAGNMGSALVKSFLSQGIATADELIVTDPDAKKLAPFKKIGITTSTKNDTTHASDIILIAVKPQSFVDLAKELMGCIRNSTIVISIMAGVPVKKIQQLLGHKKIVRAMPNTPALVGSGVTGWFAGKELNKIEKDLVQEILGSTGYAFTITTEAQIDDVTVLSGCGPGFFFYLFDQWLRALESLDIPKKEQQKLLAKTLRGCLALLESSPDSPLELAQKVASKGGATEAGLKILSKAKLEKIFVKMIKASYTRCKQLAKKS